MLSNMRKLLLNGSHTSVGGTASRAALSLLVLFMVTACGSSGGDDDKKDDGPDKPSVDLTAAPNPLPVGDSTTLTWVVSDADDCTASGGAFVGAKAVTGGTEDVVVNADTTFRLECTGPGGTRADSVDVTASPLPTVSLTADPESLPTGDSTTLTWVVTNATLCRATGTGFAGNKDEAGGTEDVVVSADTTYTLDCSGAGGAASDTATVTVVDPEFTSESVSAGANPKQLQFSWTVSTTSGIDHYTLEVNPDGASGFSQVDLNDDGVIDASDEIGSGEVSVAVTLALHFTDFNNAVYQIVARDSVGDEVLRSGDVFIVSVVVEELVGYIKASNTQTLDRFGTSTSLSADGNTLAVSAVGEDGGATGIDGNEADESQSSSGAVYVFRRAADGSWSQDAYVKASNTGANDRFGESVSLSADGNTLAVSASKESSNATGIDGDQNNDDSVDSGAVYVFVRTAGTWSQQAYVKASNTDASDGFGFGMSLSQDGDTLAVGAFGEDADTDSINGAEGDNSADNAGAVYVFVRNAGTWAQEAYVKASNSDAADRFGDSVGLSTDGNTLAVGATGEASSDTGIGGDQALNDATRSGALYVFVRTAGSWAQQAYIKASNTGAVDQLGGSVALSGDGNTLSAGASGEDSNGTNIDGTQNNNLLLGSGAAYVFARNAGNWSQQAYVKASNTDDGDAFGIIVGLSSDGNTLAVGAPFEDSSATGIDGNQADENSTSAGAVYVYVRDGATWSTDAYLKASNSEANDRFGISLSVSSDGGTIAAGATLEDGNATGIDGDANNDAKNAGAVYLY